MTLTDARPPTSGGPAAEHGERQTLLARLARFSGRRRRLVMLVWVAVIVLAAPLAVTLTSACRVPGGRRRGPPPRRCATSCAATSRKPAPRRRSSPTTRTTPIAEDPAGLRSPGRLAAGRPGRGRRSSTRSPLPPDAGLISPDGRTALVPVELAATDDADLPESAGELIDHVDGDRPARRERPPRSTGEWAVWHDFNAENEEALHRAELLSGPAHHHPAVRRLRLGDRRRASRCCSPWPASPSASRPCTCSAPGRRCRCGR